MADSTAFHAVWPETADRGVAHGLAHLAQQRDVAGRVGARAVRRCGAAPPPGGRSRPGRARTGRRTRRGRTRRCAAGCRGRSDGVVEGQDHARAERGAGLPRALEGERDVQLVGPDEAARRAAEQHRPQLGPRARRRPASSSSPQRGAERQLVDARAGRTVPETQNSLGPVELAGADRGVRLRRPASGWAAR